MLAFILLVIVACTRNEVVINTILVDRMEGSEVINLDRGEVRTLVESSLSDHHFAFRPNAKESAYLRVRYGSFKEGQVQLMLKYEKDDLEARTLEASQSIEYDGSIKAQGNFKQAITKSLEGLLAQIQDENKKVSALQTVKDYAAGTNISEAAMNAAIETLVIRRDRSAQKPLSDCLKRSNIHVSLKVLRALSVLGDADCVDAITTFAERKVPELRRHAIEAVKKIGGRKAAAWLFTLSTGHSDVQVREAAKLALKEVEGKLALN